MKDTMNNELVYIPVTGLSEGDTSDVIVIRISDMPRQSGSILTVTSNNPNGAVFARIHGSGSGFADLATTPIPLDIPSGPNLDVDIYVQAGNPIEGFVRETFDVSASSQGQALWNG